MQRESATKLISIEDWKRAARTRSRDLQILPAGSSFIARICGEALEGAAIVNDDRLCCERTDRLVRGQLGIVKTPYGIMPRFVYLEPDYVRLESANYLHPTLCLPHNEVQIIGRLVKLVRRFPDALRESEAAG